VSSGAGAGFVGHAHLVGKSAVGDPFGRLSRSGLFQHLVDLFERKTFGFWDEEEREGESEDASRAPDEENFGSKVALIRVDDVWCDVTDDKVPEPVGSGSDGDTLGTDWQRVDFTDEHPRAWTPSGGETENVETNKDDQGGVRSLGSWESGTDNSDDKFADNHEGGSTNQESSATKSFNSPEGDRSGDDVDNIGNNLNCERVLDTRLLEESGSVVEDKVDTGPLLHHLEEETEQDTTEVARWI